MRLTPIQESLVKEAFEYISGDEEYSIVDGRDCDYELDPYTPDQCSTNTLKSLKRKGFIKDYNKHQVGFSVTWDARRVCDWVTL